MTLGIEREGLREPLREPAAAVPVLGTCAGMIMLDRDHLGVLDMRCERNAFGRQVHSFEGDVALDGFDEPFHGVFIRAPWVAEHGPGVEVLGDVDGHPVAAVRAHPGGRVPPRADRRDAPAPAAPGRGLIARARRPSSLIGDRRRGRCHPYVRRLVSVLLARPLRRST